MDQDKAHLLIFPYPAQGHMMPLLNLTHQLANHGRAITMLVTPKNLPLLNPLLSKHPHIQTLVLPFPTRRHHKIPLGVEHGKELPADCTLAMMHTLSQLRDPILRWFGVHTSPPTVIISDICLGWTQQLACQLGVPRYAFSPSGAFILSVLHSLWHKLPRKTYESDDNEMLVLQNVPCCPRFPWWQLSPLYRSYASNEEDPILQFTKDSFLANYASFGLVINTLSELEMIYLDHLKEVLGHNRVWAIGPIVPPGDVADQSSPSDWCDSVLASEICAWLDKCDDSTVVYVCFGSLAVLTNEQIEALTMGLDKSGVKFILCVKGGTDAHKEGEKYGVIPSGFEDRVAERGLIIKGWAPQELILRHPAVGAFLTHCGWNPVLESIMTGVPVVGWPMVADQFANATLIVDELKIAIRAYEGEKTVPNSDDLARLLARAIAEFENERARAMELSKAAMGAVRKGGSSFRSFNDFLVHLSLEALQGKTS